jgi:branched-chain amino acid aminotransferase
MQVWVNGSLLTDPTQPIVSAFDHGLTVGDGVFEAVKILQGQAFALGPHLDRLDRSLAGLGLLRVDRAQLEEGVSAVLGAEFIPHGRVRITVTGGPAPLGSGRGDHAPTVIVAASAAPMAAEHTSVVTVPWPRNERGATAGLKTTSYAENVIALAEAHRRGATEAIFSTTAGMLCEGTGSNVFYVVDGDLRTPTLASGCLAGVTRALVLEWFGGREVDEPIDVAENADEVFLVSTLRDVQAVTRWGERDIAEGPVTRAARARWREREYDLLGR